MVINKNSEGYREEYDGEALNLMADMAEKYVRAEEFGWGYVKGSVPDGSFSDFSVAVWEMMLRLIREGEKIAAEAQERKEHPKYTQATLIAAVERYYEVGDSKFAEDVIEQLQYLCGYDYSTAHHLVYAHSNIIFRTYLGVEA